ncbi:hypothetical protein H4I96_09705, partial [Botrytis cinerea]
MSTSKDPKALSSSTSVGESAEERPARDRERGASAVADRRPFPAISLRDVDLDAAKMALKQAMQQAEEDIRHQITEPEAAREPNPWLRRVGWVEHLEGFDRTELQALVAPVRNDEPELEVLCRAFDWLIQDAQYHCIRPVVGLEALFEANRKEVDQDVRMPFDSWMDITTVIRYTEI